MVDFLSLSTWTNLEDLTDTQGYSGLPFSLCGLRSLGFGAWTRTWTWTWTQTCRNSKRFEAVYTVHCPVDEWLAWCLATWQRPVSALSRQSLASVATSPRREGHGG